MIGRRRFLAASAALAAGACAGDNSATATSTSVPVSAATTPTPQSSAVRSTSAAAPTTTTTEPGEIPFSPEIGSAPFGLGVASGDPASDSLVLWTRLVDGASGNPVTGGEAIVSYSVSRRADMADPISTGEVLTDDRLGHSVHAVVTDLDADTTWFYQFNFEGAASPVGRTRTIGSADSARLVVASCQNYEDGYFAAWRHAAAEEADLIIHVGDAIYTRDGLAPTVRTHGAGRPIDLEAFRRRYALYWADPDLQMAHASAPWCSVWDDNEVVSNYAGDHDPNGEATQDFATLRSAAYQAWWEHNPVRMEPPGNGALEIHRRIDLGPVATIWLLDGRQYRSTQVCEPLDSLPAIDRCPEVDDESRTMLGSEQELWLSSGIAEAQSSWHLIAQQTVVADFSIDIGPVSGINNDQWDGYAAARERLLADLDNHSAVVLSGDIHAAAVTRLRSGDRVVATEIVTPSISSKIDQLLALGLSLVLGGRSKPDVSYFEPASHGYVVLDIDHDRVTATFRFVDATSPTAAVESGPVAVIDRDGSLTLT